jgi:hypothetical protein
MNYHGIAREILNSGLSIQDVYEFLRKALRRVNEAKKSFRGPSILNEGSLEYRDQNTGSIDHFIGSETISYNGMIVYRLGYHGGRL